MKICLLSLAWIALAMGAGKAGATSPLPVGASCEFGDGSCGPTEAPEARCITEDYFTASNVPNDPTDQGDGWRGGYCSRLCGQGRPACPGGSVCGPTWYGGPDQVGNYCLDACRPGGGDCRPGYSCGTVASVAQPVCIPSCYSDAACQNAAGPGSICRPCDRLCVPQGNPSSQIGDNCAGPAQCGTGGVCLRFSPSADGLCSQVCSPDSCLCPNGSSCQPVGANGESYCLRDCGSGNCPGNLSCIPLVSGNVCLPGCSDDGQCPAALRCIQGACLAPDVDGGCALCRPPVSGGPPPGGTGGPAPQPPSGNGCTATESGALGLIGLFALFLPLLRRKRS